MFNKNLYNVPIVAMIISILYFLIDKIQALNIIVLKKLISFIIGIEPIINDNNIFLNLNNKLTILTISYECTGLILMIVSLSLIFIIPNIKFKDKLKSLILIPIIYIINIFRLMMSIVIGIYLNNETYIILIHNTIGQIFITVSTILLIFLYFRSIGYIKKINFMRN